MIQRFEPEEDESGEVVPFSHVAGKLGEFLSGRMPWSRRQSWKVRFEELRRELQSYSRSSRSAWPPGKQIHYVLEVQESFERGIPVLAVGHRSRRKTGEWSALQFPRLARDEVAKLPDPVDRQVIAALAGATEPGSGFWWRSSYHDSILTRYELSEALIEAVIPEVCRAGRAWLQTSKDRWDLLPLEWDDGGPWEFRVEVARSNRVYRLSGCFARGGERVGVAEPVLIVPGGFFIQKTRVARFRENGAWPWLVWLRNAGSLSVPVKERERLLEELLRAPRLPRMDLPEELRFEEARLAPRPALKVRPPEKYDRDQRRLLCAVVFDYGGRAVAHDEPGEGIFLPEPPRRICRDLEIEAKAAERLRELGVIARFDRQARRCVLKVLPEKLPRLARALVAEGWQVEAEGKLYRRASAFRLEVSTGIDWFELRGAADFEGASVDLPALLQALKKNEGWVSLGDSTLGMVPEDWLKKYGLLAGLGAASGDHVRFQKTQVGLLDALLASQPEVNVDEAFARAREALSRFDGLRAVDPEAGFTGQLRPYQRQGLGWLHFLRDFGFGGCLADDMGLGKTVQVLALLESRRRLREERAGAADRPGPSLIVVPRSLLFNWKDEGARFTPRLKIADHHGADRARDGSRFGENDVVLTTYGTLRRDALLFADVDFDYVILDEAQAVKNASTESSKAVKLLRAGHRLALSGTPVENHLGELWSLFEFLNPGMLGSRSAFGVGGSVRNPDDDTRKVLARALRPFILRRTKDQVAKDLPPRLEQTIYCELDSSQRKLYDELRDHYRSSLLAKVTADGLNRSKIQILEALLRLRQAAIHPGLVDRGRRGEPSAKLESLLAQLEEVVDEGHKALVFSQFTSMLSIVRERLDDGKVRYEYLDGRTRDRAACVARFQSDPEVKLFLVSLKAGGLGLNLTAAGYVFLLDPWWNPAVEAQAIDRAHRIGQTRHVFAYRLIARDTVEERVLELQKSKRDLADAIITADQSLIGSLKREDLELLLT